MILLKLMELPHMKKGSNISTTSPMCPQSFRTNIFNVKYQYSKTFVTDFNKTIPRDDKF